MLLPLIAVACYLFGAIELGVSAYQGDSHHGRGRRIAAAAWVRACWPRCGARARPRDGPGCLFARMPCRRRRVRS